MSLFQCQNCGCRENTALAFQGFKSFPEWFRWDGIEDRKGKLLCSACGPRLNDDGTKTEYGVWHNAFPRRYLPKGLFITNSVGNLQHKLTGETGKDMEKYYSDVEYL